MKMRRNFKNFAFAISLLCLLSACGNAPEVLPEKEGGGEAPRAPYNVKVNGIACPSAGCPANEMFLTTHSILISGSVDTDIAELSSTDTIGSLDSTNFSDGRFEFTTVLGAGEQRTITFVAISAEGVHSDPYSVTLTRNALSLSLSAVLEGSSPPVTSGSVILKNFGTVSVGATTETVSGSVSLAMGYSNIIGRINP